MSLYNLLFGQNPASDFILATLGLTSAEVGRFRDAFVTEAKIAIYTRTGGGNREAYQDSNQFLQDHPLYLSDCDDEFDSTYATFYFGFPELWRAELLALQGEAFNPSERWTKKIESIKEGELTPAMRELGEKLKQALDKPNADGPTIIEV